MSSNLHLPGAKEGCVRHFTSFPSIKKIQTECCEFRNSLSQTLFFFVHLLQSECKTVTAEIDNNLMQIPLHIPSSILFHVGFANNLQQRNGRSARPGYLSRLQAKRAQAAQTLAISWDEMEYFWKNIFLLKSVICHLEFHLSLVLEW